MGRDRVVLVHSYAKWGGNLKITKYLLEHLSSQNLEVGFAYPQDTEYAYRFEHLNIIPIQYKWRNKYDIMGLLDFVIKIIRFNPKLIHSHNRQADLLTATTSLITGIPAITTQHAQINIDDTTFKKKRDIPAQIYRLILRTAFRKVIAVAKHLEKEIQSEAFHIPSWKMTTIHNGIRPMKVVKSKIRKELGIVEDDVIITEIGTISKKGHNDLVRSAKYLFDRGYQPRYIIVGSGREKQNVVELINSSGLEDYFYLLGERNDISEILSDTDIFVLPSYSEGLPVSILEAMSLGIPVIATPVGGITEAIIDGHNGLIVDTGSTTQLAEAIAKLIENQELRNTLGENARSDFYKKFNINRMLDEYMDIYYKFVNL